MHTGVCRLGEALQFVATGMRETSMYAQVKLCFARLCARLFGYANLHVNKLTILKA